MKRWIQQVKETQAREGCTYKEALMIASRERKEKQKNNDYPRGLKGKFAKRTFGEAGLRREATDSLRDSRSGDPSGEGIIEHVQGWFDAFKHDRMNIKPEMREILKRVGDLPIIHIMIVRRPIAQVATFLMKALQTASKWLKQTFNRPHDVLFHLLMVCTLSNGERWIVEKNQNLNMEQYEPQRIDEFYQIQFRMNGLTINGLLQNALKMFDEKRIFLYDAFSTNCQLFVNDVLTASGLLTQGSDMQKWILQSVANLLPEWGKKLTTFFTSASNRWDEFVHGRGTSQASPKFALRTSRPSDKVRFANFPSTPGVEGTRSKQY